MIHLLQHIATDFIGLMICVFLICLIGKDNEMISKRTGNRFLIVIWIVLFCDASEMLSITLEWFGRPAFNVADLCLNAISVFFYVLVAVEMSYIFDENLQKYRKLFNTLIIFYLVFVVISSAMGWLFTITGNTVYNRGPLLYGNMIIPGSAMVLLVRSSQVLSAKYAHIRDGYILLMTAFLCMSIAIQIAFYGVLLIWPGISVIMMLFYIYLREMEFMIDPVTSIMNRAAFEMRLSRAERASDVAILIFDLNNLKEVNDAEGHNEGDKYLSTAAEYISDAFESNGYTFRIGGDEFGTIVYRLSEKEIEHRMGELDLRCKNNSRGYPVSIAHGYAVRSDEDHDLRDTIKRADARMYHHKISTKKIWK